LTGGALGNPRIPSIQAKGDGTGHADDGSPLPRFGLNDPIPWEVDLKR
jgi:hypothetical protein